MDFAITIHVPIESHRRDPAQARRPRKDSTYLGRLSRILKIPLAGKLGIYLPLSEVNILNPSWKGLILEPVGAYYALPTLELAYYLLIYSAGS